MRELEECKAEIFRRGNEKKIIRARRKKVTLSIVLPIFVCVMLIGFFPTIGILPPTDGGDTVDTGGSLDGGYGDSVGGIQQFSLASVEASEDGFLLYNKRIFVGEDFERIYSAIYRIVNDHNGSAILPDGDPDAKNDFTITFIGSNSEKRFAIRGNFLIYDGIQRSLSDEELLKIKAVIEA